MHPWLGRTFGVEKRSGTVGREEFYWSEFIKLTVHFLFFFLIKSCGNLPCFFYYFFLNWARDWDDGMKNLQQRQTIYRFLMNISSGLTVQLITKRGDFFCYEKEKLIKEKKKEFQNRNYLTHHRIISLLCPIHIIFEGSRPIFFIYIYITMYSPWIRSN